MGNQISFSDVIPFNKFIALNPQNIEIGGSYKFITTYDMPNIIIKVVLSI